MEVGMKTVTGIKIDREFQNLIPALSTEEREQLEANIVEHGGARDPLVVWQREDDSDVLLDGHNRYEICERLGLPYEVEHLEFNTRDEAADWIDRNQLGRRNLSKQDYKLLLGRRYNRAKKAAHRPYNVEKVTALPERTSERLAKEHGVTEKTVRNAGKFQAAAAKLGIEKDIAAGAVKATEAAVVKAATSLSKQPTRQQVEAAREELRQEKPKRRATKPAVEVFKAYPPTRCLEAVTFYAQQFLERCPTRASELRAALVELIASCDATK
jgi:ParB-like chromosome segregation protein Spo0J